LRLRLRVWALCVCVWRRGYLFTVCSVSVSQWRSIDGWLACLLAGFFLLTHSLTHSLIAHCHCSLFTDRSLSLSLRPSLSFIHSLTQLNSTHRPTNERTTDRCSLFGRSLFVRSFGRSFVCLLFGRSFVRSIVRLFGRSLVESVVRSLNGSFVRLFGRLFVCSFARSLIRLPGRLVGRSSFIGSLVPWLSRRVP